MSETSPGQSGWCTPAFTSVATTIVTRPTTIAKTVMRERNFTRRLWLVRRWLLIFRHTTGTFVPVQRDQVVAEQLDDAQGRDDANC